MDRFKNLLCVVDPQRPSGEVLARAAGLAETNQALLKVIATVEPVTAGAMGASHRLNDAELQAKWVEEARQQLQSATSAYRQRITIETEVLIGVPFLEVIREVLRGGHDLVIKEPDPTGWMNRLLGSDDLHLLRKCPCPVWMVKAGAPHRYQRILAAVDVGVGYPTAELATRHALNRRIMAIAASLALSEFAELHVVHIWRAIGESAMQGGFMHKPPAEIAAYVQEVEAQHRLALDALIQETVATLGREAMDYLRPVPHLVKGSVRRELPGVAEAVGADVVVMGTVARTGVPGFIMGNTAETILGQIDCSILAVKPPGFVTPVQLES